MMNTNKKWNGGFAVGIAALSLLGSCAKFETRDFHVDKPQRIIDQEALDAYDVLKSYVDFSGQPLFNLGAELSLSDVQNSTLLYQLVRKHFTEVNVEPNFNHQAFITEEGELQLSAIEQAVDRLSTDELSLHGGHLVWHSRQRGQYLRDLTPVIIIPGQSGRDLIEDFEGAPLGTSWPMHNTGSAVVVEDPFGVGDQNSGHVLNVTGSQPFPRINVNLPEGRKLGDYTHVIFDMYATDQTGRFGAGMRMTINNKPLASYGNAASFGVPNGGSWGRGAVRLELDPLNLTAAEKELTNFTVSIGSATGAGNYYIDNVRMEYYIPGGTYEQFTDEEKRAIYTAELEKYIEGVVDAAKSHVRSWSVLYQPLNDEAPYGLRTSVSTADIPADQFYWQDYFGDNYGVLAFNLVRQYGNTDDKLFVTETNLTNMDKRNSLIDYISYIDNNGATVDGIAAELALNATTINEVAIETMLEELVNTGKLVKISALDIGTGTNINEATSALYGQQAKMYQWFIETYFRLVPAAQRAGITFRSPLDRAANATWRPNQPVGLWTGSNGYQRKVAYEGVVKALENSN